MKQRNHYIVLTVLLASACSGLTSCAGQHNVQFVVRVSGNLKTEFKGDCSHEVTQRFGGSRTEAIDVAGRIDVHQATYEFPASGVNIACSIANTTPETSMTVELLKDGVPFKQVQTSGAEPQVYIDYYPPQP